jgi:hypothetical protein
MFTIKERFFLRKSIRKSNLEFCKSIFKNKNTSEWIKEDLIEDRNSVARINSNISEDIYNNTNKTKIKHKNN